MAYFSTAASPGGFALAESPPSAYGVVSHFDFDSDKLGPQQHRALLEIARRMLAGPTTTFRLIGYTDAAGTPQYNLRLGHRRAAGIQRALVGILERMRPGSSRRFRFAVESAGAAQPVVPSQRGPEGGPNRRVVVLASGGSVPASTPLPVPRPPAPPPPALPEPYRGPSIGPAPPALSSRWCLGGQIGCRTLDYLRRKGGIYRRVSAEDRETAIRIEHRELMAEEIPPLHPVRRTAWLHELRRKAENRVDDAIAGIVRR